jgi:hypothetical protein
MIPKKVTKSSIYYENNNDSIKNLQIENKKYLKDKIKYIENIIINITKNYNILDIDSNINYIKNNSNNLINFSLLFNDITLTKIIKETNIQTIKNILNEIYYFLHTIIKTKKINNIIYFSFLVSRFFFIFHFINLSDINYYFFSLSNHSCSNSEIYITEIKNNPNFKNYKNKKYNNSNIDIFGFILLFEKIEKLLHSQFLLKDLNIFNIIGYLFLDKNFNIIYSDGYTKNLIFEDDNITIKNLFTDYITDYSKNLLIIEHNINLSDINQNNSAHQYYLVDYLNKKNMLFTIRIKNNNNNNEDLKTLIGRFSQIFLGNEENNKIIHPTILLEVKLSKNIQFFKQNSS